MRKIVKVFEELFPGDEGPESKTYLKAMHNMADEEPGFVPPQEDEVSLSSGEKAALARGLDLITEPQMAALYLVAKARLARREDKSDTYAGRMAQKMNRDVDKEDFRDVPYGRLADLLDMNPLTVSRTTNKFMLMLKGEEKESEVLYTKVIDAFQRFQSMPDAEVIGLAEDAINYGAEDVRASAYREKMSGQAKASKQRVESREAEIRRQIRRTFLSLKDAKGGEDAARLTAMALAKTFGTERDNIKSLARAEFSKDPIMLKYWK